MRDGKKDEALAIKEEIGKISNEIVELENREAILEKDIHEKMMVIPNIIDDSVPI